MVLTSEVVRFGRDVEDRSPELKRGIEELDSVWKRVWDHIID